MTDQPALFAAPKWADKFHVGQHIHDGVRDGIVTDIISCPAAIDDVAVVLRYPDGHETSFGFGHTLSIISGESLLDASDEPGSAVGPLPGSPSAGGSGAGAPADPASASAAVHTTASLPASSPPKAITNGACDNGDGLSELDISAGAIPGEAQDGDERVREPRMAPPVPASPGDWSVSKTDCGGSTPPRHALTNRNAPAQRDLPGA